MVSQVFTYQEISYIYTSPHSNDYLQIYPSLFSGSSTALLFLGKRNRTEPGQGRSDGILVHILRREVGA